VLLMQCCSCSVVHAALFMKCCSCSVVHEVLFMQCCSCSVVHAVLFMQCCGRTYSPSAIHSSSRTPPLRAIWVLLRPRGAMKLGRRSPDGLSGEQDRKHNHLSTRTTRSYTLFTLLSQAELSQAELSQVK
jgi:hypothetical protein